MGQAAWGHASLRLENKKTMTLRNSLFSDEVSNKGGRNLIIVMG